MTIFAPENIEETSERKLFTLLPISSLDGSVILRELRNWHN